MPKSVILAMPPGHHHDVGGLHVAVDDVLLVREPQAVGDLGDDVDHLRGRGQLARGDDVLELVALEELHRHVRHLVGLADVVDGDDVGMVQAPRGLDLLLEALLVLLQLLAREVQVDRLDRDRAVDDRVDRLVDGPHRPLADLGDDLVAAERRDHGVSSSWGARKRPAAPACAPSRSSRGRLRPCRRWPSSPAPWRRRTCASTTDGPLRPA
jgi:hypothetical protein